MASNLACIGLSVAGNDELSALVGAVRPRAKTFGRVGRVELLRWEDESSGARLVLGIDDGRVVDLLPSLASPAVTHLADVHRANDATVTAAVVDDDGEQVTALAVELEQRRLVSNLTTTCRAPGTSSPGPSFSWVRCRPSNRPNRPHRGNAGGAGRPDDPGTAPRSRQSVPGEGLEPSRPEGPAGLSRDLGVQGSRWILCRAL